jgi:hypothetical protein
LDIAERGIPAPWARTMRVVGFDPAEHTKDEFVEFCERLEQNENSSREPGNGLTYPRRENSSGRNGALLPASAPPRVGYSKPKRGREKYCLLHNTDSHDLGECKVMLDQAQRMRSSWMTAANYNQPKRTKIEAKKPPPPPQPFQTQDEKIRQRTYHMTKDQLQHIISASVKRARENTTAGKKRKEFFQMTEDDREKDENRNMAIEAGMDEDEVEDWVKFFETFGITDAESDHGTDGNQKNEDEDDDDDWEKVK